jgi:hypothetical protein
MNLTVAAAAMAIAATLSASITACAAGPGAQAGGDCVGTVEFAGVTYVPLMVKGPSPGALGDPVGEATGTGASSTTCQAPQAPRRLHLTCAKPLRWWACRPAG